MRASVVISGVTLTLISGPETPILKSDDMVVDLAPGNPIVPPIGRAQLHTSKLKKKPTEVVLEGHITLELVACALTVACVQFKPNVLDRITQEDVKLQRALDAFIACQDPDCASDKLRFLVGQLTRETVALPSRAQVHAAAPARSGWIEAEGRYNL